MLVVSTQTLAIHFTCPLVMNPEEIIGCFRGALVVWGFWNGIPNIVWQCTHMQLWAATRTSLRPTGDNMNGNAVCMDMQCGQRSNQLDRCIYVPQSLYFFSNVTLLLTVHFFQYVIRNFLTRLPSSNQEVSLEHSGSVHKHVQTGVYVLLYRQHIKLAKPLS